MIIKLFASRCRRIAAPAALLMATALAGCGGGGGGGIAGGGGAAADAAPWGQVALGGTAFADVTAAAKVVPNTVPLHTVGEAGLQRLDWVMDNAYTARSSLPVPDPRVIAHLFVTSEAGVSGALVGTFDLVVDVAPAGGAAKRASVSLLCGGTSPSGVFSALPRQAGCDAITLDWTRRELKLGALALANGAGTLDGTLKFTSHEPAAATTARAAALRTCALTPAGAAVALPAADTAACLAGTYVGTSDTGGTCSVTIEVPASGTPKVQVAVDGYAQTYAHLARRQGETKPGTAGELHWTYWFTTAATDGSDPSDASNPRGVSEFVMADFGNLATLAASGGPVLGVGFAVAHATAPAGVAGPVDVKFCSVPLPE